MDLKLRKGMAGIKYSDIISSDHEVGRKSDQYETPEESALGLQVRLAYCIISSKCPSNEIP